MWTMAPSLSKTVSNLNWVYHWSTITLLSLGLRCTLVVGKKRQRLNAFSFHHQVFFTEINSIIRDQWWEYSEHKKIQTSQGGVAWEQIRTRRELIHCTYRNKTDRCGERQCHILSSFQVLGLLDFLGDDHDVAKRIASANASMGAMSDFWDDNHVDVYSKYLIFWAITCNLLL